MGSQLQQLVSKSKLTIDDIVCAALSSSLPTEWNSTISGLLSQSSVSSNALISALRREGIRRQDHATASSTQVLAVTSERPQPAAMSRPFNTKKNVKQSNYRPQSNAQGSGESCTHCGMRNHQWQSCHKLAKEWFARVVQNQLGTSSSPQANVVLQESSYNPVPVASSVTHNSQPPSAWNPAPDTHLYRPEGSGFLVTDESFALTTDSSHRVWVLDSGCTQSCLPVFLPQELDVSFPTVSHVSTIKVANGIRLNISSQRSLPVPWDSSGPCLTVLEVPGLKHSLLSISQLRNLGYTTLFLKDDIEIHDKDKVVVAKGCYRNGLPILDQPAK